MNIFRSPGRAEILALLEACGLPAADVGKLDTGLFFGCGDRHDPSGVIGLEIHGQLGLLRSLAVAGRARGGGCGTALVAALEEWAGHNGIATLYLLTNTAETFFARRGYRKRARATVPAAIRRTQEFASLCPGDAVVMSKDLAAGRRPAGA